MQLGMHTVATIAGEWDYSRIKCGSMAGNYSAGLRQELLVEEVAVPAELTM